MGHHERLRTAQGRAARRARVLPLDRRGSDHEADPGQPGAHRRRVQPPDAMAQHAEMVSIYESNGVTCHYLDADEALQPQLLRPRFERHDPLGSAHLPHAVEEPAGRLRDRHPLLPGPRHPRSGATPPPGTSRAATSTSWSRDSCSSGGGGGGATAASVPSARGRSRWRGGCAEQGWEAVAAPISAGVRAHGRLVAPLAPKLLVALRGRDGGLAGGAAARARLRVRGGGLRGGQGSRRQPGRPRQRPRALDAGVAGPERRLRAMGSMSSTRTCRCSPWAGAASHCLCQALCRDEA